MLRLSSLADIIGLGIGLYLALGVVQAVSAGGVAGLRRRADILQRTAGRARLANEFAPIRSLQLDVSRIEIGFESLNRSILLAVTILFMLGLVPFVLSPFWGEFVVGLPGAIGAVVYYIVTPCCIYLVTSLIISRRCKTVSQNIKSAENRIKKALLGP